ncbi:hypothetical protein DN069_24390 [Streptacidiphilus pinicola]|uniref:Uncharacterized protein n=1 Tax=Streptacidiphilus pinicola TaxID=2219663 RepID=A0A2X0IDE7_9ACTN|nr:hypothetical protein [Streptacidiphilus pinicola]RAG83014.1 hypothetical protein DN069_24390 [Streptacidiphilus pinicola]
MPKPKRRTQRADDEPAATSPAEGSADGPDADLTEDPAERRRRRAVFLRELAEARALRERVQPRRTKALRLRQAARMRTFRF